MGSAEGSAVVQKEAAIPRFSAVKDTLIRSPNEPPEGKVEGGVPL